MKRNSLDTATRPGERGRGSAISETMVEIKQQGLPARVMIGTKINLHVFK